MRNPAPKLILLAILLVGLLEAQEVILERYPEGVDFWVMVPYNTLIFGSGSDSAAAAGDCSRDKMSNGRQAKSTIPYRFNAWRVFMRILTHRRILRPCKAR